MKFRKMAALLVSVGMVLSSGICVQAAETGKAEEAAEAEEDRIAVQIMLEGTEAKAGSDSVKIDGSVVTITEGGTYILSGSLSNGQIVVDAGESARVRLILSGVRITSDGGECIAVKEAGEVTVTLKEGSENILADNDAAENSGRPIPEEEYSRQKSEDDYRDAYDYEDAYDYRDAYGYEDAFDYPDAYGYADDYRDSFDYGGEDDFEFREEGCGNGCPAQAPPHGRHRPGRPGKRAGSESSESGTGSGDSSRAS